MRKIFFVSILLFVFLVLKTQETNAHLPGQPPFFKVNGTYTAYYSVTGTSLDDFNLPQDIATDRYIVNDSISFEIIKSELPVPQEIVDKTKFIWDFDDGQKGEGLKNNHIYKKPGSYIQSIYADTSGFEKGVEPQLIQSTIIHVLPHKDYELPISKITVNGQKVDDPIGDWLTFSPGAQLTFDSALSTSSSAIASYTWDLGDGTKFEGKKVSYTYKNQQLVFPILRITTADGFIADSYIEIHNGEVDTTKNEASENEIPTSSSNKQTSILIGTLVIILLAASVFYLKKKK